MAGLHHEEIRQSHPDDVEDLADRITLRQAASNEPLTLGVERIGTHSIDN